MNNKTQKVVKNKDPNRYVAAHKECGKLHKLNESIFNGRSEIGTTIDPVVSSQVLLQLMLADFLLRITSVLCDH